MLMQTATMTTSKLVVTAYTFADWKGGMKPPKGWDVADAVRDGWSPKEYDTFLRARIRPYYVAKPKLVEAPPLADKLKPVAGPVTEARTVEQAKPKIAVTDVAKPLILDRSDPLPSARALIDVKYMRGEIRALHHYRGVFYEWNGFHYREIDDDAIKAIIWTVLEHALHPIKGSLEPFQPNTTRVKNVHEALAAACNLPASIEAPTWLTDRGDLPPANEFLPVKNGLLHLPSGDLYPPTPNYFGLSSAGVEHDHGAPDPVEWFRFLDQVWPGDPQSIETLQDLFGYLLSPDTSHQKIGLMVGPKRSGKGTMARVLTALLGQASVAAPTLAGLATNFGLAPLIGKSLAIIGDARLSSRADQAAISERLLSISGEDNLTIDRKFLSAWTGRLGARFLIMTNELPRLADASGALASRFVVLTMEQSFYGKEDRGLGSRLMGELSGILNWALVGYCRLRKRGHFLQPDSARDAIDELEALGSPIAAFIKERCRVASGMRCAGASLFAAWVDWCSSNGRKEPGTAATFGRDLRAAVPGLKVSQPRVDGRQTRFYEGIDIASTGDDCNPLGGDW